METLDFGEIMERNPEPSEKASDGLEEAQECLRYLERAIEQAFNANLHWQRVTGFDYATLVDHYKLKTLFQATRVHAASEAIGHVSNRRFPGLPCNAEEWAREALADDIHLVEIEAWYADHVGPTADEKTWAHMLQEARKTLVRVGEWSEQRFEAKQSGRRLTLSLCVWRRRFGTDWSNAHSDCRARLIGLEAVVRYADGVDYGLGVRGDLYNPVCEQTEPGKAYTNWACVPQIRTFKNGRFDIWLRDEALALKVKTILEIT